MLAKTLVIQTAFPGDAILTLPLIQKLKETEADRTIGVIAIPATKDIFISSPVVDEVFVLDKRGEHKKLRDVKKFAKQFSTLGYNKIITPHRSLRTALLVYFSAIKDSTGFSNAALPFVFNKVVTYDKRAHEVKRNLSLIDYAGDWRIKPVIEISQECRDKIRERMQRAGENVVAVAPGSVWETKKYPEEYFSEIIKKLAGKKNNVVLVGGKSDKELCARIIAKAGVSAYNFAGEFTIPETTELLRHCEMLICNDSAPTHMGVAAGIRVNTIYCSTVPSFGFFPYGEYDNSIGLDELRCKPCGIHGYKKCPESHFDCGLKLTPESVISKIFS